MTAGVAAATVFLTFYFYHKKMFGYVPTESTENTEIYSPTDFTEDTEHHCSTSVSITSGEVPIWVMADIL